MDHVEQGDSSSKRPCLSNNVITVEDIKLSLADDLVSNTETSVQLQDSAKTRPIYFSSNASSKETPSSASFRRTFTAITAASRFGLGLANVISQTVFSGVAAGTKIGIGAAREVVSVGTGVAQTIRRSIGTDGEPQGSWSQIIDSSAELGATIVDNALDLGEFVALTGLELSKTMTSAVLTSAEQSLQLVQILGSPEEARSFSEFIQLVRREMNRDDGLGPLSGIGILDSTIGLTTWAALENATHQRWLRDLPGLTPVALVKGELQSGSKDENTETVTVTGSIEGTIVEGDIAEEKMGPDTEGQTARDRPYFLNTEQISEEESTHDLLYNLRRYSKFSTSAYGERVLQFLGLKKNADGENATAVPPTSTGSQHLPSHLSFSHYTESSLEDIIHSSFSEPEPSEYHPTFYILRDQATHSIIVALRGTLSLRDLLVDLTCEYVNFQMEEDQGKIPPPSYSIHSGMLKAAGIIAKPKGPLGVFEALKRALEECESYGIVIVGHSLGGAIASLLGLLWASPTTLRTTKESLLPPGRPVHVYAIAPPCVMSAPLALRCKKLITSLVYSNDLVCRLSLGSVRDIKKATLVLYKDRELCNKIMATTREKDKDSDDWLWSLRKTVQADMTSEKLYPAGQIYWIVPNATDTALPAFDKKKSTQSIASDSTTYQLMRVSDVEAAFGHIAFASGMLYDHLPHVYERVLQNL